RLARPVASDHAISTGSWSDTDNIRVAYSANAVSDLADNWSGTTTGGRSCGGGAGSGGACSRITCALVPLIPNADTPARRIRGPGGHGVGWVTTRTDPLDQSTAGVSRSAYKVGGTIPRRMDSIILITPATPAAACA